MINDEVDEVIEKCFEALKYRYQNNLISIKGSEFVFNNIHLLSQNKSQSWWIKKVTIILVNKKDNKCFQHAVTKTQEKNLKS